MNCIRNKQPESASAQPATLVIGALYRLSEVGVRRVSQRRSSPLVQLREAAEERVAAALRVQAMTLRAM